jgi:hypothetical protein
MSVSRAIKGSEYYPDVNDISMESSMDKNVYRSLDQTIGMIWDSMYLPKISKPSWRSFHLTTKSGIFGPALTSSIIEAALLPADIKNSIRVVGGEELYEKMESLNGIDKENMICSLKLPKTMIKRLLSESRDFRKISVVHAPERKSRLIAVFDYWSQSSLKPLHDRLMSILKGIDQDMTFNQADKKKILYPKLGENFYSIDLKSATDRFPIDVIALVLKQLINDEEYIDHWKKLMIGTKFKLPRNYKDEYITYSAGNPMGAYSSWASFALAHHIMIRYAAMTVGEMYFSDYLLLGDDVVIQSDKVANSYLSLMKGLGVDISTMKTHVSKDTYEFAKRWYKDGKEVTGAQLNAFLSTDGKYHLLAQEYVNLLIRWDYDPFSEARDSAEILEDFLTVNKSYKKRLLKKINQFLSLPRNIMGPDIKSQCLEFVKKVNPSVLGCFDNNSERAYTWYTQAMGESKVRILDASTLKLIGVSKTYLKSMRNLLKDFKGLNAQKALMAIPSVNLLSDQFTVLNNEIERLRDPTEINPESATFNNIIRTGFDPERIHVVRSSVVMSAMNATMFNVIKQWTGEYNKVKTLVIEDSLDENTERAKSRSLYRTKVIGTVMPGFPL